MTRKYSDYESCVDCFFLLLFRSISFFVKWLYITGIPQLRLHLNFGPVIKEAIPDLTVLDLVSFL